MEKHLSTMWETWVQSLDWEDSLEKEMATHSSTLALKIPWTEELGAGYYPWDRKESGTTERLHFHFHFTHWKESYDQPRQHIKKQRQYFVNYVHLVKAIVFPVVMYGFESWTIKNAEHQRINTFELWCWRRLLRVPWTARRSNQSILKEISPVYSLEALMLKLKLQYFGHLMWRADSFEKTMMLGKIEGRRRRGNREWDGWMAYPTWRTWVWVDSRSWSWTGRTGMLWFMGSQRVGHDWATEMNWTELDSSPPGFFVHVIFQARILQWVTIYYSRVSSQPRGWTHVSCVSYIGRQILYLSVTWEAIKLSI